MSASSSVFGKYYNRKNNEHKNPIPLYNFILLLSVFIGWSVLFAFKFSFNVAVLPYSLLFAFSYTVCNLGIILALKYGPASLTSLFVGLSLLPTTIWGFIFWDAKINNIVILGLILVSVSIVLCLSGGKEDKKISINWIFFVFLALFGNSGCAIIQRTQQLKFNGEYGEMLMAFASLFSLIVFFIVFLLNNMQKLDKSYPNGLHFPVLAGVCNVILNVFVILLATSDLSPSLVYPTIGVGGVIVVIIVSLFAFKEKLYIKQWVGVLVGIVATVLLSL